MNIGLDIDNVITDFDGILLKEFLLEDKNKRNRGVINPKAIHITKGMFDWSAEEVEDFYINNMERIAPKMRKRKFCKRYMDKLLQDGHKLILISHRAYPDYKNPRELTLNWLVEHEINYTKLVLSRSPDKTEECLANNIDIMIDDRADQCEIMRNNGINVMLMFTRYNQKEKGDLPYATSWKNLYHNLKTYSIYQKFLWVE